MNWKPGKISTENFLKFADESMQDAVNVVADHAVKSMLEFARRLDAEGNPAMPREFALQALAAFLKGMADRQINHVRWMNDGKDVIEMLKECLADSGEDYYEQAAGIAKK